MWAKKLRVLVNKMVGSSHNLIALRLVRSKLRKREETNNNSLGHGPTRTSDGAKVSFAPSHLGNGVATLESAAIVTTTTTAVAAVTASATAAAVTVTATVPALDGVNHGADITDEEDVVVEAKVPAGLELFLWSYPGQQLSSYSGTKDTLVRELPCETPQDSKGLRKNLRGKWKRLVKRKPEESCSIPPELRDQLKQIYVY